MSIAARCSGCGTQYQFPEANAGRNVRCRCGQVVAVPAVGVKLPSLPPVGPSGHASPAAVPAAVAESPSPPPLPPQTSPGFSGSPSVAARSFPALAQFKGAGPNRPLVLGISGLGGIVVLLALVWLLKPQVGASDALKYLPNDSQVVVSCNVDELVNSKLYQQLKTEVPNFQKGEREFEGEFGVSLDNIARMTVGGNSGGTVSDDVVGVVRLKKGVTAADVCTKMKVRESRKDVAFKEISVGKFTIYDETYRFSWRDEKSDVEHGEAFCLPESTLLLFAKLEPLRRVLERNKAPELPEKMREVLRTADFSTTFGLAVNINALVSRGLPKNFLQEANRNLGVSLPENDEFLQGLDGLVVDAHLASSQATLNATLLCKEAKVAEDVKKVLDAAQVVLRNTLKQAPGVPREASELVDSVKFLTSGAKVTGNLSTNLDPLLKEITALGGGASKRAQLDAQINAARAQVGLIDTPLHMYFLDMSSYPPSLQALIQPPANAPDSQKWKGPYLEKGLPLDPWGNPYQYQCPGQHNPGSYDLWSTGPDGVKIIGNWD